MNLALVLKELGYNYGLERGSPMNSIVSHYNTSINEQMVDIHKQTCMNSHLMGHCQLGKQQLKRFPV